MKIQNKASIVKIAIFIAGGLLGIYAVFGFYIFPILVKSKLPALIEQETGRKAYFSWVKVDPFTLRLRLQGFELQGLNDQLFVGFDELFVDINGLQSIRQARLVIDKFFVNKPVLHLAKHQDGTFNFSDLIKHNSEAEDNKIFPVSIESLSITEGMLDWEDAYLKVPEKEVAYPINFAIDNLTTPMDTPSNLRLTLNIGSGGKLDWQGDLSLNPMISSGHIKLDNVQLPRVWALALQNIAQLNLQGYELFEADYKADYIANKFNVEITQGKFELRDFQLSQTAQDKALVKIPALAILGLSFNLYKHELTLASVVANDADFQLGLNTKGMFNYLPLLTTAKLENKSAESASWSIKVNKIELNNMGLSFEDHTHKKSITTTVKPINLILTDFSNKAGASQSFQLSAGLNQTGMIKLTGNAILEPLSAQIDVNVNDIALVNFQGYVDQFARLDVIDGVLAIKGKVQVDRSAPEKLNFKFKGNTKITDLLTRDQLKNKDLVKWENLTLNGIDIDLSANQYHAETLVINKPYARLVIRKDKSVNFGDILIADKSKPIDAVKNTQTTAPKPTFKLDKIEIIGGSSDFADLSLILPFSAQIKSLRGGASGISSEPASTIKVNLKGNAYDLSPVDVLAKISPYLEDYDMRLSFVGMPMPLISSYMVQFAGYKVEKGKMSLELNYKIVNKELVATNNILIDQLELGDKVENPDAVSLPLKLAVALLKDSKGKIKIDVPISGSLEDPQFSISHILVDALVNSIAKVVSSPFRALTSLAGNEEDLSTVSFTAGEAILSKTETSKLADLAKALKLRQILNLEVKGAAFQEPDWPAVSDDALYDQLKRIKSLELSKQGGKKIRAEYVIISDQDYRRLMEQLFIENFPLMVEKSLLGKTRLVGSQADTNTDLFYAVAKEKLSAIIQPEPQRLKDLASQRAQTIANYIVQEGGIANDRVFILDTVIDPVRKGGGIVSLLSLKVE
jgi:hypothetical protein